MSHTEEKNPYVSTDAEEHSQTNSDIEIESQTTATTFGKHDLNVDGNEVLNRKMFLVNNALDEIGFTWYHAKLFVLAGFGYSVDSQLTMVHSSVSTYINRQFGQEFPLATIMLFLGLLLGSLFWGLGSDIIGRKTAFNVSLLSSAVFGLLTGGMNSYATYTLFVALNAFSAGGNLATDVTVFLEVSPARYTWLTTFMAGWWNVGQTVATLLAWAFIPKFSCAAGSACTSKDNRGWRYTWYANSGLVLFLGLVRILFFTMEESPKYLVSNGKEEEAVAMLQKIATKYGRTCSLTVEDLQACGELEDSFGFRENGYTLKSVVRAIVSHVKTLYVTKKVTYSTSLIFLSWLLIGLSYSTFFNFLYIYIASHGGDTSASVDITYRNTTLSTFIGIFGPVVAGYIVTIKKIGRKGTMTIGAVGGMAILFGYTTVRTSNQDLAFASMTYFFMNIYYGCLYAYTPEVFPAIARTTGCALALVSARVAGVCAPLIYYYGAKSGSAVPIWVCGALIGCLGIISLLLPFEPTKFRSV